MRSERDVHALPRILDKVSGIDIFHYDSDKSISGRDFGIAQARRKLAPGGIILVDDILNDSWFREYVESRGEPFIILEGRVGVIGDIEALRG
jgi:predicted O-methyltransferase YrrM